MMKAADWKPGLPPGNWSKMSPSERQLLIERYEVHWSPGGLQWHRRRTEDEIAAYRERREGAPQ
jgi:hypothetical protein